MNPHEHPLTSPAAPPPPTGADPNDAQANEPVANNTEPNHAEPSSTEPITGPPSESDPTDAELLARAALMRAADVGDKLMGKLVRLSGAQAALAAIRSGTLPPDYPTGNPTTDLSKRLPAWQARLEHADPTNDLATGEKTGARLIIPGMPEWPTQLNDLGNGSPLGLWLHGSADLRYSCLRSVAVVGARAATAYGVHVAAEFGIGLSEAGWSVISGGAYGIDGAAHRGALAGGSPTVVVLACGTDVCYPSGHHSLFEAVRDQGVIVSECPPGVHPTRARFLIRNRLIAALSRGTVVIEAAQRSGALNTASHAISLDRHLAAVPGAITSEQSAGCHRLLRERTAVCVTSPEEMIELVGVIGADLAPQTRGPAIPRDALNEPTRRVLDAVPSRGTAGPATIAVAAGVDLPTALSCLGGLAAAGYIDRTPTGWRLRRPTPPPAHPSLANPPALANPQPPDTNPGRQARTPTRDSKSPNPEPPPQPTSPSPLAPAH
ncbi:DNA-processing protein DprA [Nonomuraea sp. NPDC050556]|uniref:DNA-processing protein DprA n=1 Tax=Nonomuraea sp. NPDC050556 TaxID=3364369 RepID=UPI0037954209